MLTGIYSVSLIGKQAAVTRQVKAMTVAGKNGEGLWSLDDKLPVVLGASSVLGFLETHTVARIAVIYEPLMWNYWHDKRLPHEDMKPPAPCMRFPHVSRWERLVEDANGRFVVS